MKSEKEQLVYDVYSKSEFDSLVSLLLRAKYAIKEYLPSIQTAVFRTLNGDLKISAFSLDHEDTQSLSYRGEHAYIQLEGVDVDDSKPKGTDVTIRHKYINGDSLSIGGRKGRLSLDILVDALERQKPPLDHTKDIVQKNILTSLFELADYHNYKDIEIKDENGTAKVTLCTPFNGELRTFVITEPEHNMGTPTGVVYIGNKANLKTAYEIMSWVLSQEAQGRKR